MSSRDSGLLEWKEKLCALKPLRGKNLVLRVSNTAKYSLLREKAEEKWSFHSNLYDDELSYELLYEDGQKALFFYLVPLNYFLCKDIKRKWGRILTK